MQPIGPFSLISGPELSEQTADLTLFPVWSLESDTNTETESCVRKRSLDWWPLNSLWPFCWGVFSWELNSCWAWIKHSFILRGRWRMEALGVCGGVLLLIGWDSSTGVSKMSALLSSHYCPAISATSSSRWKLPLKFPGPDSKDVSPKQLEVTPKF